MAIYAYVNIQGKVQGSFRGNDKHKFSAPCLQFAYQVEAPRDAATGQARGKRQHKPITVTKEWGASSPQLYQALFSNEVLDSVVFQFPDQNAKGPEKLHPRIELTNATVLQIRHIGGGKDEVVFVYEEISVSGGTPPLEARLTHLTAVG